MKYVVGDIHGEITKLKNLITYIKTLDFKAEFIFIGDYMDKGESTKKTLDYLKLLAIDSPCVFLMGNHEYMWLEYQKENIKIKEYLLKYGGEETINSFDARKTIENIRDQIKSDYQIIFENLVPYWSCKEFVVTHSGIAPEDMNKNIDEISIEKFLFNRYDFIKITKKFMGKTMIFGHTGFYTPYYDGYKIGIDTAACYTKNQPITAFCIDNKQFINSNSEIVSLSNLSLDCSPAIVRTKPWRIK